MDYEKLRIDLNNNAKKYLQLIYNQYASYLTKEKQQLILDLLNTNFVLVNENADYFLKFKLDEIKDLDLSEEEKNNYLKVPLAHGGRTLGDGVIHFYPFTLGSSNYDDILNECNGVLVHEMFHYLIRPEEIKNVKDGEYSINTITTEGLVDMVARDFIRDNKICSRYNSEYYNYVLMFREAFENISDIDKKYDLIFNGSVSYIYTELSKYGVDFNKEVPLAISKTKEEKVSYVVDSDNITRLEQFAYSIVKNKDMYFPNNPSDLAVYRAIKNDAANYDNPLTQLENKLNNKNNTNISNGNSLQRKLKTNNNGFVNVCIMSILIIISCIIFALISLIIIKKIV